MRFNNIFRVELHLPEMDARGNSRYWRLSRARRLSLAWGGYARGSFGIVRAWCFDYEKIEMLRVALFGNADDEVELRGRRTQQ